MKLNLPERRRFIRVDVPLRVTVKTSSKAYETVSKNISPIGLRFELPEGLNDTEILDLAINLPSTGAEVEAKGKIAWQMKTSLEDNAAYDFGIEIVEVKDEDKNVLLKYLCDLLYATPCQIRS